MNNTQEIIDTATTSEVAAYNPIAAGIQAMLDCHGHVLTNPPVVTGNAAALAVVKASRQELIKFRTTLEKARKTAKADSLAYGRLVDSEAERIQAFATPLELAYDQIVNEEEARLANIKAVELEAERKRIAGHQARIQAIKDLRETANLCRSAERIQQLLDSMPAMLAGGFEEFEIEADGTYTEVETALKELLQVKLEAETAAKQLAVQQEQLRIQQIDIDRKAKIQMQISDMRMLLVRAGSAPDAPAINYFLERAKEVVIDDSYGEFRLEAEHTQDSVCEQIEAFHTAKLAQQAAAELVAQQARVNAAHGARLEQQQRGLDEQAASLIAAEAAKAAQPLASRVIAAIVGEKPDFSGNQAVVAQHTRAQSAPENVADTVPTGLDLVTVLAMEYGEHHRVVLGWLAALDIEALRAEIEFEFA